MAIINTIEDLIQLLDDNPRWVEALRARLLTRDLVELPESIANSWKLPVGALTGLRDSWTGL